MLWRVSRQIRTRSKPAGFNLPYQPALADRPPSGPNWLHEIKVRTAIVSASGRALRPIIPTPSPASALPIDTAVIDGEAIVLRSDNTSDFEALRS